MTSEMKLELLKRQLLSILNDCGGYLLPETTLEQHARILVPDTLHSEFAEAVGSLESGGLVVGVRGELSRARSWKITANGRAVLAEARG